MNGPGGDYDMSWIPPHAVPYAARDHLVALTASATTVLLGNEGFVGFGGFWPSVVADDAADPRDRAFARWLITVEKVVFLTASTETQWPNSRIAHNSTASVVDDLRRQPGGDILALGGSRVIKDLLAADQVDTLSLVVCPEIAGNGDRLFDDGLAESSWALTDATPTETGAICLLYDRRPDPSARR